VGSGLVRPGWYGTAGSVRHGLVRLAKARCPSQGWSGVGWAGLAWRCEAGRELAGLVRQGPAGVARVARHGMHGAGTAWLARRVLVAGFWLRAAWLAWLGEHGRASQGRGRMGRQAWPVWGGMAWNAQVGRVWLAWHGPGGLSCQDGSGW